MIKHALARKLAAIAMALTLPTLAHALTFDDLRPNAPPCKQTKAKRPMLPADKELPYLDVLRYDFNGDGWCDYVVGVPYPVNSQMDSYYINQMMLLGGEKQWKPVLHGRKPFLPPITELDNRQWPTFQVDLTAIQLIYPKAGGAPYVLGLMAGGADDPYQTVYRWDNAAGTFRCVDEATAKVVLGFYNQRIEPLCRDRGRCNKIAECSGASRCLPPAKGK